MNALDSMLGLNDGNFDLLDENFSFTSLKATPLAAFNTNNDKVKPRGLRVNDSDRNANSNSPIPGLNRAKVNDNKVKTNNTVRFHKSDGVRFNENIKSETISTNNNISIFSPEANFSDHLTRLAGHTPLVDSNNNSNNDEGRKYVDMHNFNYDTKWSPLDTNSPTSFSSSNIKPNVTVNPSISNDNITNNDINAVCDFSNNASPSFLITNNNGYSFNDSIDIHPNNNRDTITSSSPSVNANINTNNNSNITSNASPSYQNFKSISVDALTSNMSPNVNISPTIINYLEQDEIKKQEDSPQISQRMSFKKDSPIIVQHLVNQIPTPRSAPRSSSAPPTRLVSNFDNGNSYPSPRNASNISPYQDTYVQASNRHPRGYYDDIVCSPYSPGYSNHNRTINTSKQSVINIPSLNSNNYDNITINSNNMHYSGPDNENTGVSRIRPGLGSRKNKFNHAFKHETTMNDGGLKPISNPNPPSAIKVANPSVLGPDKKQNPFTRIHSNATNIYVPSTANATTETTIADQEDISSTSDITNCLNPHDVSIQCPSVQDAETNINSDSVNFDDNSSYGDNDDKGGLEALINPNPNPIKSLLSKISSSSKNLGTASRVLKNGYSSSNENLKSSLKHDFDVRAVDLNVTFSEDNLSINESVFEPVFATITGSKHNERDEIVSSLDLNNSMAMTCVTTLTLDSLDGVESDSFDVSPKSKAKTNVAKAGPRLNLASKKVKKDDFEDMKEVTMQTIPGEFTTIMLEFGNKKNSKQTILSKATCMRFDPAINSDESFNISDVFQVSPRTLDIPLNSHKAIYLTFAPVSCNEGIYTGVLKIKNSKKSFVLLLRGEARYPAVDSNPVNKNDRNIENSLNDKSDRDYDFEVSDDENKQSDDDEPLLGLELDIGLARPPDYTKFSGLLAETNSNPYYHSINNDIKGSNPRNISNYDWSINTATRLDEMKRPSSASSYHKYINTSTHASATVENNINGPKSNDSIADKVASDLLKVRQKVIKDWLGKENNKRKEIRPAASAASPSMTTSSLASSNIFSVLSKNSSTYQPTPKSVTNGVNTQPNTILASKSTPYTSSSNYNFGTNSTASSKQTMYSTLGLKSNELADTHNDNITSPSIGLFFRRQSITFGPVAVGTLARLKVELCNGSDKDVSVLIGDPALPFVLLHNEVHVKARSYVRIPIRFVPVFHNSSGYTAELIAQTTDGQLISKINLNGSTY